MTVTPTVLMVWFVIYDAETERIFIYPVEIGQSLEIKYNDQGGFEKIKWKGFLDCDFKSAHILGTL